MDYRKYGETYYIRMDRDEEIIGTIHHHTHALLAFKNGEEHCTAAGHMKSITVSYTAEIELHPVIGGGIGRKYNEETGTGFWDFKGC